jgi:hypothetical protein
VFAQHVQVTGLQRAAHRIGRRRARIARFELRRRGRLQAPGVEAPAQNAFEPLHHVVGAARAAAVGGRQVGNRVRVLRRLRVVEHEAQTRVQLARFVGRQARLVVRVVEAVARREHQLAEAAERKALRHVQGLIEAHQHAFDRFELRRAVQRQPQPRRPDRARGATNVELRQLRKLRRALGVRAAAFELDHRAAGLHVVADLQRHRVARREDEEAFGRGRVGVGHRLLDEEAVQAARRTKVRRDHAAHAHHLTDQRAQCAGALHGGDVLQRLRWRGAHRQCRGVSRCFSGRRLRRGAFVVG